MKRSEDYQCHRSNYYPSTSLPGATLTPERICSARHCAHPTRRFVPHGRIAIQRKTSRTNWLHRRRIFPMQVGIWVNSTLRLPVVAERPIQRFMRRSGKSLICGRLARRYSCSRSIEELAALCVSISAMRSSGGSCRRGSGGFEKQAAKREQRDRKSVGAHPEALLR